MLPLGFRKMFEPAPVPEQFDRLFPKELMLRPIQLRASNEDAALMTPAVMELEQHYGELTVPVVIVTGGDDQIADVGRQSERLHQELPGSEFNSQSTFIRLAPHFTVLDIWSGFGIKAPPPLQKQRRLLIAHDD
jgi:pimeloyl-ACP methyl ester carboxylesterase